MNNTRNRHICRLQALSICASYEPHPSVNQTGNLSAAFQAGGGIHLNAAGNRIWIGELRKAIGIVQQSKGGQPASNPSVSR